MDMLNSLLECILCGAAPSKSTVQMTNSFNNEKSHGYVSLIEKDTPSIQPITTKSSNPKTPEEAASQILTALLSAPKPGPSLDASIRSIIHTHRPSTASWNTWYASLAKAIFHKIENLLKERSTRLSGAMDDACHKASDAAATTGEFAREHPLWTAAVVAIVVFGIMVLLAPYLLEALGFAELGPVEGEYFADLDGRGVEADGVGVRVFCCRMAGSVFGCCAYGVVVFIFSALGDGLEEDRCVKEG